MELTKNKLEDIVFDKISPKKVFVDCSVYFGDEFIRVLPVTRYRMNKKGVETEVRSFLRKDRDILRKLFPNDKSLISSTCAHIRIIQERNIENEM